MSDLSRDSEKAAADAAAAIGAARRRIAGRALGWLCAHPRTMLAIAAAALAIAAAAGLARG